MTAKTMALPFNIPINQLQTDLILLGLPFMAEHHPDLANRVTRDGLGHVDYLAKLTEGELHLRRDRATLRRVRNARFPVIKTLDQFSWNWPKSINRMAVQNLFHLQFHKENANIIFLGAVGLGKTHLATALGYAACLAGKSVLFSTAVDAINTLAAAQAANRLKVELKKYLSPSLLILDELGYLPIDKLGADLLFQIISQRYERGSIIITSNRAFKQWPEIFNNDSMLTSAILDRLLHHAETMIIEGKSYRMKDQIDQ
ncbi:MAG: IS21-like element helper ATPase IstB [Desulfuromonadales bacterium]|nr:IS21-like element helper ATPase IstB [Desulfuromonadales bacterium]